MQGHIYKYIYKRFEKKKKNAFQEYKNTIVWTASLNFGWHSVRDNVRDIQGDKAVFGEAWFAESPWKLVLLKFYLNRLHTTPLKTLLVWRAVKIITSKLKCEECTLRSHWHVKKKKKRIYTGDKEKDTRYLFLDCRVYTDHTCTIPILFIVEMNKPAIYMLRITKYVVRLLRTINYV